jgi:dolichol-phosphate mannosyltransferase
LRPQPYAAVLLAALLFAPVVIWNYTHDWASFRFQGGERFVEPARFQLHVMLMNILLVATPLPLLALPLLWTRRWAAVPALEPAHAEPRNRLFVACITGLPLAVFAWSALKHEPRLNWTGPIWLATLPMLGWAIVQGPAMARARLGQALRGLAGPVIGLLLVAYAAASYHLVLGIPGLPYTGAFARFRGWQQATAELRAVQARVQQETGASPVVVGLDKYNTASQVAFYGAAPSVPPGQPALKATSLATFNDNALMFSYWDPPASLAGRPLILVAREREDLATGKLGAKFTALDEAIHPLALGNTRPGGSGRHIDTYYYRIGYGFQP